MTEITWEQARAQKLAGFSPAERAAYELSFAQSGLALRLAELVYAARTSAGLTQTELAERMGTRQSVISHIENGGQVPTVAMLERIARATGQTLKVEMVANAG